MKIGIAELLKKVSEEKSKNARVKMLRENASFPLKILLQYTFDPNIKWLLPEGKAPYKKSNLEDLETVFFSEARRLYLFIEGGNNDLKQNRRETLFIELLESLAPDDADLLVAAKDKRNPYPYITYKLAKEAFPDLLP